MTQTKLEIIGLYTPEHEGPHIWLYGHAFPCVVHSVAGGMAFITAEATGNTFCTAVENIRNAREVPAAREFWVNEYNDGFGPLKLSEQSAKDSGSDGLLRTIHVREVLPGEDA
ncbi:MAG: hypothetical protein ABF785_04385 [Acetobacter papayae]|uniref:hypothetical protein n=1 Tax=Acetobacter papayae TaxID=1076592 RepID=UPI0039E9CE59